MKKTNWFLFFLLFAVSCLDQPDCFLLNNDKVGVFFRVIGSGGADSVSLRSLNVENIIGFEQMDEDTVITTILLPINYFKETSEVQLVEEGILKRLLMSYKVQSQFVSEDCGPRYVLSELSVQEMEGFDSVRIVNNTPGSDRNTRNIEIFRCPQRDTLAIRLNQLLLPASTASINAVRSRVIGAEFTSISLDNGVAVYQGKRAATVHLPVDLTKDNTNYTFTFSDQFALNSPVRDLGITYTRTTSKPYKACGELTSVTRITLVPGVNPAFDSVSFARNSNGVARNFLSDPYETNLNVYRCPETNLVQIAFREGTSGAAVKINRITADYTTQEFYSDTTFRIIQLPLNKNAATSTFTFDTEGGTQSITFTHTWIPIPTRFYKNACSNLTITNNLGIQGTLPGVSIQSAEVLFPPVTNVNLDVTP